jgi:tryptophanase
VVFHLPWVRFILDFHLFYFLSFIWQSQFNRDEAYGRNHGYYAVLDVVRDVFERGVEQPGTLARQLMLNLPNITFQPSDEDLHRPPSGGFANGGFLQLSRPN